MWPPVWVGIAAPLGRTPIGEVGRLLEVRRYPDRPSRIFMTMEYDGAHYTGALLFDDNAACAQVYSTLRRYCGASILAVGSLDVPLDLDELTTYRKASACQTWHCCMNCSHWPEDKFEQRPMLPDGGELCNECKTLQEHGNCQ
jgi:hypothetical protein